MPTIDNQHDKNTPAPAEALSLTFFSGDLNQDITVQGYLQRLLSDLWQKEESFNGKRPFGNSGWQWEVYGALIEAGHIPGEIDEDGCIEDVDEQAGEAFVLSLIGQIGTAALARAEEAEARVRELDGLSAAALNYRAACAPLAELFTAWQLAKYRYVNESNVVIGGTEEQLAMIQAEDVLDEQRRVAQAAREKLADAVFALAESPS